MRDPAVPAHAVSKVPQVTLLFWVLKIAATTLGETGGDAVSMSLNLGYLVGTAIFAVIFAIAVGVQIKASRFNPAIYSITIVATTTVGTTIADYVDRSLGIGYPGGASLLLLLLLASLFVWYRTLGTVAVESVSTPKAEIFYWVTIMFSQTLGTALGDWMADSNRARLRRERPGIRRCTAAPSRPPTSGRRFRAPCSSGRPSFSRGHWVPSSAISSTSRSLMAA